PDEIESITVLKNENAIEKYGEKGKNGVIEVYLKEKKEAVSVLEILENKTVNLAPEFDSSNFADLPTFTCGVEGVPISIEENEYDLAVLDLGYESFLAMQPSTETYSLSYLRNKNKQYVSVWNSRVTTGNPAIYEMPIDYESQTFYGLEFEYKLFQFFKFMEDKYKISFI